jgi:hypothetical protein
VTDPDDANDSVHYSETISQDFPPSVFAMFNTISSPDPEVPGISERDFELEKNIENF